MEQLHDPSGATLGKRPWEWVQNPGIIFLPSLEARDSTCDIHGHNHRRTKVYHHFHLFHTKCRSCTRYTATRTASHWPTCSWWTVDKWGDLIGKYFRQSSTFSPPYLIFHTQRRQLAPQLSQFSYYSLYLQDRSHNSQMVQRQTEILRIFISMRMKNLAKLN